MQGTFVRHGTVFMAAVALLLAACGGARPDAGAGEAAGASEAPARTGDPTPPDGEATHAEAQITEDATADADNTTAGPAEGSQDAAATLEPIGGSSVSGEALLRWDPATSILTVTLALTGLEPDARYSGQITSGCDMGTGHVHKLDDLVGSADGSVEVTTEVAGVEGIDVDGGWSVKVGRPPAGGGKGGGPGAGGPPPGAGPQACGEVGPTP